MKLTSSVPQFSLPFQLEWALAARNRPMMFVSAMPEIVALFDDGADDRGRVLILGPGRNDDYGNATVQTLIPGTSRTFDVPTEFLFVDEATAKHLEAAKTQEAEIEREARFNRAVANVAARRCSRANFFLCRRG